MGRVSFVSLAVVAIFLAILAGNHLDAQTLTYKEIEHIKDLNDQCVRRAEVEASMTPEARQKCRDIRGKYDRAVMDCSRFLARFRSATPAAREQSPDASMLQPTCEAIVARSSGSRNAGWDTAHKMEQERLQRARTNCERQWGNLHSMVEHCEKRAQEVATAPVTADPSQDAPRRGDMTAAVRAYERGDYAAALQELHPLAKRGHAGAQFGLGLLYAFGRGVPQDDIEAVRWYTLAAEQGHASAQSNLADMYEHGRGVTQDLVLAHVWYSLAAMRYPEGTDRERSARDAEAVGTRLKGTQLIYAKDLISQWVSKLPARSR